MRLTAGLRYTKDDKQIRDADITLETIDASGFAGGQLGPGPVFSRVWQFLFGFGGFRDRETFAFHNATDAYEAAIGTPPFSPERYAAADLIPPSRALGESRFTTNSPSEQSWDAYTGNVVLEWVVGPHTMFYSQFARGSKPGGFNPIVAINGPPEIKPFFEGETVDSIEIGLKNVLRDGSLMLNLTAFAYNYEGPQVTQIILESSRRGNIDADVWGFEIESSIRPGFLPRLALDVSYSYLGTEVSGSALDPTHRAQGDPDLVLLKHIGPNGFYFGKNYVARIDEVLPSRARRTGRRRGNQRNKRCGTRHDIPERYSGLLFPLVPW